MRCCTCFILIILFVLLPTILIYSYMTYFYKPANESQTTEEKYVPSTRPQYSWSDKDMYPLTASSTVLGRATLTASGQFDVFTTGPTLRSSQPTITSSSTPQTTTTISTTTTTTPIPTITTKPTTTSRTLSTFSTETPSQPASLPTLDVDTVNTVAKSINPIDTNQLLDFTPKPTVTLTTPGTTEEMIAWKVFKNNYRRRFPHVEEEERRRNIFIGNKRLIEDHNEKPNNLFTLEINKFADYTNEEINKLFIGPMMNVPPIDTPSLQFLADSDTLARAIDFRNSISIEPVDQGLCLDSAVYAAIGSIESAYTKQNDINYGSSTMNIKLSEQQVIDCLNTTKAIPQICTGNLTITQVFEFLQKVPVSGLVSLKEYSQRRNSDSIPPQMCNISKPEEKVTLGSYSVVNQEHIVDALDNSGPLAFPIDASQSIFHFYKSGIFHSLNCSTQRYNYHTLLMGFIPESNHTQSHYIIRNSFGKDWGEGGYMRILRDANRNKCLPQNVAIYPNLNSF